RVRVNLLTARALRGDTARAEADLAALTSREGVVGLTAGYNLGTLRGEQKDYDGGLAALRDVLERNPADADARWNYELLLRKKQEQEHRPQKPPEQKPQSGGGGGGGSAQPQQGPSGPQPQLPPSSSPAPPPGTGRSGNMDRAQAERLLGALEELSRSEQKNQRKV